jgi:hypothetical protein
MYFVYNVVLMQKGWIIFVKNFFIKSGFGNSSKSSYIVTLNGYLIE